MTPSPIHQLRRDAALQEIEAADFFKNIRWIEKTDSTNKQLAHEIREGRVETPAILIATKQTGGKGRGGNRWFSPSGCLMFSMAIPFQMGSPSLLPLEIGVGIAQAIAPLLQTAPQVKWPNDIYIAGRKAGGILIEVQSNTSSQPSFAIVGVGLNCEVDFTSAEPSIQQSATSLHQYRASANQSDTCREDVLLKILERWMEIDEIRQEKPDWLHHEWKNYSLLDGKWVVVDQAVSTREHGRIEGRCLGIDSQGALLIAQPSGAVAAVIAGTIQSFQDTEPSMFHEGQNG